jgi:hypothetical protein
MLIGFVAPAGDDQEVLTSINPKFLLLFLP